MIKLERIEDNHKIGYKDNFGNIVVSPIYDDGQLSVESFSPEDGIAYISVLKNGKCGIIDQSGNVVIPFEYDEAYHLLNNLFAVRKNTECKDWAFGVIDNNGAMIIPFEYKLIKQDHCFIQCFSNASSERKYSHCYMDSSGHIYEYHPQKGDEIWYNASGKKIYKGGGICTHDYLIIEENEKLGAIDFNGNKIIQCLYSEIYCTKKDRFVVRLDKDTSWQFGVIDNNERTIIDFNYKYISHAHPFFYECFEEALCEHTYTNLSFGNNMYSDLKNAVWYNQQGIRIFEGKAKILSNNHLAILSNDKWGVLTQSNKKVVNFLYDSVSSIQDKLVVVKDARLGILESDGSILINPSYNKIECATTDDSTYRGGFAPIIYGQYSQDCKFDTEDKKSQILNVVISYDKSVRSNQISITNESMFDFDKLFILHSDNYCELFSAKDGIIANSRYEIIQKLTNISFTVGQNKKWGVFRGDVGEIIIPCEYDRIIFEGGHIVFLSKENLWGAKTLELQSSFLYHAMNVDVPIRYKEIKMLDATQSLFGVKIERTTNDDSTIEEYTIVDKKGNPYGRMSDFSHLDRQCEIFDHNYERILASQNGKYGFISTDGYVTIPFQYDFVERRDDGMFNVQIDESWGVVDITGREIVRIKYSDKIPQVYENAIVQNALTKRYGILSEDGIEKVPSIYEHLMIKNGFIFFGYDGYEAEEGGNFFSSVDYAIWGVMNNTGKVIIKPEYDFYEIQDEFLLAGRNGKMLCYDEDYYGLDDYTGVYDLYSSTGELIFGGVSEFFYNKENDIFIFFLGGEWDSYSDLVDEWNRIYINKYVFKRDMGRWLFLNKDFKSIIRDSNGNQFAFKKGTICRIEVKREGRQKTFVYNMEVPTSAIRYAISKEKTYIRKMPVGVMANEFYGVSRNNIIIADSNNEDCQKFAALNVDSGKLTPFHQKITSIGESIFFFSEEDKIGIRDYDEIIVSAEFLFMTYPVNGFYFVAKELDNNYSNLALRSLSDEKLQIEAINKISTSELIDNVLCGRLKIKCETKEAILKNIILPKHDIFDKSFIGNISPKKSYYFCQKFNDIYWFADDYRMKLMKEEGRLSIYGNCDNYDDAEDTWDAMTDGMYGDMPEDFDGDYSFLGR